MNKIAVIGAGLSGLTVATQLKPYAEVTVFEKSRGVGGRMATRRADPYAFDHGAQFFTIHDDSFAAFLSPMIKEGIVQRWDARFAEFNGAEIIAERQWDEHYPHYVGAPSQSAVGKYLAKQCSVELSCRITKLERSGAGWHLYDQSGCLKGPFDWVVAAVPAAQATALLPTNFSAFGQLQKVTMKSCYSLMLGFQQPLNLPFEAALIHNADISWISVNSSKPKRPDNYALLVHATNDWADAHIDQELNQVSNHLLTQTSQIIGADLSLANHIDLHRWRFANIDKQQGENCFIDQQQSLATCGDWCIQGRVEAAFISGLSLAQQLIDKIK